MSTIIRDLRDRTGLSQAKFSEHFGIPVSTLRKWEQGESEPAPYVAKLLATQIPADNGSLKKIKTKDGTEYYYDGLQKAVLDTLGNSICISENLDEVKEQNLPLYVEELFESFYAAQEQFNRSCRLDRQEDIIWR